MDQSFAKPQEGNLIIFKYKNWKGKISERKVIFKYFFFGKTKFHPEYQCFMVGFDLDKMEYRQFAVNDVLALSVVEM